MSPHLPLIHSTAIVSPDATLGKDVQIGPYCIVGPHVNLGDGVVLKSHVVIEQHTCIGAETTIYPFAVLGSAPQHRAYQGEPTQLEIGCNVLIREHVTIHRGTVEGGGITRVGDGCMLMVGVHVAHDVQVGKGVLIANNTQLGGHVVVGDYANIGGMSAIHQFVRIGQRAMIGGKTAILADIIPYGLVVCHENRLASLNAVGFKRMGMARDEIEAARDAFFTLFESDDQPFAQRVQILAEKSDHPRVVTEILEFIRTPSKRSLSHKKGS